MDLVLGVSMTSTAVRWVLVEGTTGEGAPIDRGRLDDHTLDVDDLLRAAIGANGAVAQNRLHAVGVTWTSAAEGPASAVLEALRARGIDDVVVVSDVEATEALAGGIAEITGYEDLVVCIAERDVVLVASCGAGGVRVDRLDADDVLSAPGLAQREAEAVFVLGTGGPEPITAALEASASSVITAAEADFALARGVALASARAVNALGVQAARPHRMKRIGALASVLAAAVLTLVVSLSVAVGLRLTPDVTPEQQQISNTADQRAQLTDPPSAAKLAPQPPPPAAPAPAAPLPVAETIAVAVPPAPEAVPVEPVYQPPAAVPVASVPAYVPPAPPAYVPPAPPAYVPPAQVPKPRLRDRIIERIPIINRFHEPQYQYPQ